MKRRAWKIRYAILLVAGVLGILWARPEVREAGGWRAGPGPAASTASRVSAPAATVSAGLSEGERQVRIQEYWRAANAGLAETPLPAVKSVRNVSTSLKAQIRRRDGHRCVICASTVQLEVDHKVALENGGGNDAANLATLCDGCHTIKTRMDHSLRRHREKSGR